MLNNFTEYKESYNDLYSVLLRSLSIEKSLTQADKDVIVNYLVHLNGEFSDIKHLLQKISKTAWNEAENNINEAVKNGVRHINILDKNYPINLKEIATPPLVLFVRGNLEANLANNSSKSQNNNSSPAISASAPLINLAIVGMREASIEGKKIARKISEELSYHLINIVSGLAYGIDTSAHLGAIAACTNAKENYNTKITPGIVVLGSGVSSIYPKHNIELVEHLIELGGAMLSEYPIFAPPQNFHFPARNRIISGLSSAVLIVEAREKSGSLITARLALEQGRDVFAIPWAINNANNTGTNKLIQQGASLITCAKDILNNFSPLQLKNILEGQKQIQSKTQNEKSEADLETKNLNIIRENDNCDLDGIINNLSIDTHLAMSALNKLELDKKIFVHPGNIYSLDKFINI